MFPLLSRKKICGNRKHHTGRLATADNNKGATKTPRRREQGDQGRGNTANQKTNEAQEQQSVVSARSMHGTAYTDGKGDNNNPTTIIRKQ